MTALHLKLIRDLRRMWPQLLAIATVIGAGVAVCITMLSALSSLQMSRDAYYDTSHFADVFTSVRRAPESVLPRLREIAGVDVAESRIVADVTIDVRGLEEPAIGRLISIPDEGLPTLNQLLIRRGSYPGADRDDQVLASESFVSAHALQVGDTFGAVINGRWKRLTIAGVALSPEYVYSIRGGDLFPDDKRFGVFWARRRTLASAFDLNGAFNDVVIRLSRGASASSVLERVDDELRRYGGQGAYARKDQTSAWYLENELGQLANMGWVTPFIFAAVAAFLLHTVMSRVVSTQREQIGLLKAFGYSSGAVARHYIGFAVAVASLGVVIGVAVGVWGGAEWTRLYARFFRFPALTFRLPVGVVMIAAAAAVGLAMVASVMSASTAARVPPAEAMRPRPPAAYRKGVLDTVLAAAVVPITVRIMIRNIARRPVRSVLSVAAIALAVGIVIVGTFTVDAVHFLTDVQFNTAQRQDATVVLKDPRSRRALHELAHMPGVVRAEAVRVVAVRLRSAQRSRRVGLVGLSNDATLARVVDERLRPVSLPSDGIVLVDALASALGVRQGDKVTIEVLEGARPVRAAVVADIVTDYLGLGAYMDASALNRFLREGPVMSGAYLHIDSSLTPALYRALKTTPGLASVSLSNVARKSFEDTLAAVIGTVTAMFGLFGAAIAFAVIYNNNRIVFTERARELGSLHVLGFSHAEMAEILLGEMAILTLLALPLGVATGYGLGALVVTLFSTELARIPLVIAPSTMAVALVITIVSAVVSGLAMWRQLVRLDVIAVLKAPE